MTTTEERLARIESAEQMASPWPWFTTGESYGASHGPEYEVSDGVGNGIWIAHCQFRPDALLIAHLRNECRWLVARVRKLDAVREAANEALKETSLGWRFFSCNNPACPHCMTVDVLKQVLANCEEP